MIQSNTEGNAQKTVVEGGKTGTGLCPTYVLFAYCEVPQSSTAFPPSSSSMVMWFEDC